MRSWEVRQVGGGGGGQAHGGGGGGVCASVVESVCPCAVLCVGWGHGCCWCRRMMGQSIACLGDA